MPTPSYTFETQFMPAELKKTTLEAFDASGEERLNGLEPGRAWMQTERQAVWTRK